MSATGENGRAEAEDLRAELATLYAALEGIQHRLERSASSAVSADDEGHVIGPTEPRRAVSATPVGGVPGGTGPTRAAMAAPPGGVTGGTGPRRAVLPVEGPRGPTGPLGPIRGVTGHAGPPDQTSAERRLVLPSGTNVEVSATTKWIWIDGVLVVF